MSSATGATCRRTRSRVSGPRSRRRRKPKSRRDEEGLLSDVPLTLPGLTRAVKLQAKAATVGFDWNDVRLVLDKIREETAEIEAALDSKDATAIAEETGDLLFAVANLARHIGADPEAAIRSTNEKFMRRFAYIESEIARSGKKLGEVSLADMDALWNAAKTLEK